jgi:hypothetical protein
VGVKEPADLAELCRRQRGHPLVAQPARQQRHDLRRAGQPPQRRRQPVVPVTKRVLEEPFERLVGRHAERVGDGPQAHHGAVDLGLRPERGAGHRVQQLGVRAALDRDADPAVTRLARAGADVLSHVLLEHDHAAGERVLQQPQDDGQRHLVGQVGDDLGERRERHGQGVPPQQGDVAVRCGEAGQPRPELPVTLDRDDVRGPAGQPRGDVADSRADLQDRVLRVKPGVADLTVGDGRLHQEALPEPMLRPDAAQHAGHGRTRR